MCLKNPEVKGRSRRNRKAASETAQEHSCLSFKGMWRIQHLEAARYLRILGHHTQVRVSNDENPSSFHTVSMDLQDHCSFKAPLNITK